MSNKLSVTIESDAWIKEANSYMNIDPQFKTFFPDNCFIARGTSRENQPILMERGISIEYQGAGAAVPCFMELRSGGKFRPSNRGAIKAFYKSSSAKVGDCIEFIKVADRTYRVVLNKPSK